jgi:hypothetical protein
MKLIAAVPGGITALLFFIAGGLWAQSPQEEIFRYPLDQQNMNAFKTTCSRLAEHSFVRGNFEQEKTISRSKRSLKSSGAFIIAQGLGMVWDTEKPVPSTLALGKDYVIQSRPGGKKSVLNAQGNETFLRMAEMISSIFSGNSQGLLDNFKVYYAASGADWELGLIPVNKAINAFIDKIILKGDSAITFIQIIEHNGNTTNYTLSNHRYPAELSAYEKSLFQIP